MSHSGRLEQLQSYGRAGLGIRKGVMVVHKVIAAGRGDGLQLVVGQPAAEVASGSRERVKELIIRVVHLIYLEHCLEAALVKA